MNTDSDIRKYAHKLIDRVDLVKLQAILELLEEDYFTREEIAEIHELSNGSDWTDWRAIRRDV
jgi:hypothetical protein